MKQSDLFSLRYDGDDLGARIHGSRTVFKVWAPTASRVALNLYHAGDGCGAFAHIEMKQGEQGVWACSAPCGHGTYYTYSVTTEAGTSEAMDPYARAAGVNGDRGMVIDLPSTDPEGFRDDDYIAPIERYGDAVIWEVHVRDFSIANPASAFPGKYLAFTETGLKHKAGLPIGVDYLRRLGVTHVHLQPVYDFATVDERAAAPQYNWGYDPKNYNVPEGSYSTDPRHGEVRVREFKQMVQALHRNGIGVVLDAVYNHTHSLDSSFNRIVPGYYYRLNPDGSPANGSGCGNETASERPMFRKFMLDSVRYWMKEYHVDGFRFDLMALHDLETMQRIEQAVHAVNPRALLYGEGWTGGLSPLAEKKRASLSNAGRIRASDGAAGSIAVFNDRLRDALKGSVFNAGDTGYINGTPDPYRTEGVLFGLRGARGGGADWQVRDAMAVNYMSCHDNQTLWDKLRVSAPDAARSELLAMNRLGASVVMLSRGIPFLLAGEEQLRSKHGDGNSYRSPDRINRINWSALKPDSDEWRMAEFYRALIHLRRRSPFLTRGEVSAEEEENGVIFARYKLDRRTVGLAWINPGRQPLLRSLPAGSWRILLCGALAINGESSPVSGSAFVPEQGALLLQKVLPED